MFMVGINDREWNLGLGRIPYGEYDISGEKKQVRLLDRLYLPVFTAVRRYRNTKWCSGIIRKRK